MEKPVLALRAETQRLPYPSDCQPSPSNERLLRTGAGSEAGVEIGAVDGAVDGEGLGGGAAGGGDWTGGGEDGPTLGVGTRPKS
jgi:hypothetical protein